MTLSTQPCGTEKDFDCSIQTQPLDKPCGGEPESDVGEDLRRAQYLRDLETLDRIERQREEQDPCFFSSMGEIIAARLEGSVG